MGAARLFRPAAQGTAVPPQNSPAIVSSPEKPFYDEDKGLPFEKIHRKYQDRIYNFILRLVLDPEDAADLTQTTFVNAHKNWASFRGESKVSTWLTQIAYNCCKNHFKQKDRRRERETMSLDDTIETSEGELSREVADWSNVPERLLLDNEFAEQVRRAVAALPEEYRVVLVLSMSDRSYEEIAQVTGLTIPNVKTRLHRARLRIRERLEPYYKNWSR